MLATGAAESRRLLWTGPQGSYLADYIFKNAAIQIYNRAREAVCKCNYKHPAYKCFSKITFRQVLQKNTEGKQCVLCTRCYISIGNTIITIIYSTNMINKDIIADTSGKVIEMYTWNVLLNSSNDLQLIQWPTIARINQINCETGNGCGTVIVHSLDIYTSAGAANAQHSCSEPWKFREI